jgi:hypothetical protein
MPSCQLSRAYDAEDRISSPRHPRGVERRIHATSAERHQKQVERSSRPERQGEEAGNQSRQFLGTTGGTRPRMAMNDVREFFVDRRNCSSTEPARKHGPPDNLFVVDDQLHFVRTQAPGPVALRAIAQGPTTPGFTSNPFNPNNVGDEFGNPWGVWNPILIGMPVTDDMFGIVQFIRSIYFDSQVTVGLISNVTAFVSGPSGQNPGGPAIDVEDARTGEILTAKQTAAGRDFINELAGSRRAMAHALLYVGRGNLDYIQYQIDNHHPDAWKGYNISNAAKVDSGPMRPWRHDDENVACPTFELIENIARKLGPGGNVIAVHKGLARGAPAIHRRIPLRPAQGDDRLLT